VNRIDRLFAITTQLQAQGRVRAADLAGIFEVSTRTIYRDIAALSEAGVPVVSLPGQGYGLAEGYFLPPLQLSRNEAVALLFGARLVMSRASHELAAAANQAISKIVSTIRQEAREPLRQLDTIVQFWPPPDGTPSLHANDRQIEALIAAIAHRHIIAMRYFSRTRGASTVRQVEPHRLVHADGRWYVEGYCRLRGGIRSFRLDRIDNLEIEEETFVPRPSDGEQSNPTRLQVRVRFHGLAARWVQERQHWSYLSHEWSGDDLIVTYAPSAAGELAPWLLGWGTAAEVLSPPEMRARIRDEAQRVVEMLT
jgi:predicted DNA-binding transcriptional regulator YafY